MRSLASNSLWRDRAFVLFWLAVSISVAGKTITTVVLPILIFRLTGSAFQTALLSVFAVVPYLLFDLISGVADWADRRRLMIGCDLFNTLLLAPPTRFALLPPTVRVLCSALTRRVGNDSREGLHFLWQHRLVRTLTLLCFGNSLSAGAVTGLRVRELRVRRAQGRQS